MGILKAIGDFLFGWKPEIFDEKGKVLHKHSEKFWKKWDQRFTDNADYKWENHKGRMQAENPKQKH